MSPTALVTGATGFAGGFLVEHYVGMGWEVHGTAHAGGRESWRPGGAAWHEVDLSSPEDTRRLVARIRPSVVAHLAAQSSVRESLVRPMRTIDANVGMQLNVLSAVAEEVPAARILVVGSGDEYGDVRADENPIDERQELRPLTPYALSKVAQDLMGFQYYKSHSLDVVRVRPFVQIGPRRSDRFVAGAFARQVAEIEAGIAPPVVEVGNIDLQRDITDVRDVVRGYALLLEKARAGEVYNLGRGTSATLRELLLLMVRAAGIEAEIRPSPALHRAAEPPVLTANPTKIMTETGWAPRVSLAQSAADTLDYWRGRVAAQSRSAL